MKEKEILIPDEQIIDYSLSEDEQKKKSEERFEKIEQAFKELGIDK
ncbi:hypothetical protein KSU03_12145 [Fusobacterium polymorphum]|nr:hypothetical protein [Fusobacterium polymorphum]